MNEDVQELRVHVHHVHLLLKILLVQRGGYHLEIRGSHLHANVCYGVPDIRTGIVNDYSQAFLQVKHRALVQAIRIQNDLTEDLSQGVILGEVRVELRVV
jgi:hypothetical protein